jgi:hypothetical protein
MTHLSAENTPLIRTLRRWAATRFCSTSTSASDKPAEQEIRDLPNGIVFEATDLNWTMVLTKLTLEGFEVEIKLNLLPCVSQMLNDLHDVCIWCRQQEGMV